MRRKQEKRPSGRDVVGLGVTAAALLAVFVAAVAIPGTTQAVRAVLAMMFLGPLALLVTAVFLSVLWRWIVLSVPRPAETGTPAVGAGEEPPTLHPMVDRVRELLGAESSRPEHRAMAEGLEALLRAAGPPRELAGSDLVAAFLVCARHSVRHCPEEAARLQLEGVLTTPRRLAEGGQVDAKEVEAAGDLATRLHREAEAAGNAASLALRQAMDQGGVTPEIGRRFEESGRAVRASRAAAQCLAATAHQLGIRAEWAIPDTLALERLFSLAGENAARQVLAVDKGLGLELLSELIQACQQAPSSEHQSRREAPRSEQR